MAVVYQAVFATDEFVGFADFLLRGDDCRWIVQDTKLARHARVTALMQLAAYVDQLDRLGVPHSDRVELLLGDGTTSTHQVRDLMPVFRLRRDRLRALIADRDLAAGAAGASIAWGDDRGDLRVVACGRCATCDAEASWLAANCSMSERSESVSLVGMCTLTWATRSPRSPDWRSLVTPRFFRTIVSSGWHPAGTVRDQALV